MPSSDRRRSRPRAPRSPHWWSAGRQRVVAAVVAVGLLVSLVIVVLNTEGYAATNAKVADSSVWVTNDVLGAVGRLNRQIDELNSAVKANKPFDVLQDGNAVLITDSFKHEIRPVDQASVTLTGRIAIPDDALTALGGGVLAIADPATGEIWAGPLASMVGLDTQAIPPLLTTAPGVAVTVSGDGVVFAVAPGSGLLWSVRFEIDGRPSGWSIGDDGVPAPPAPATLPGAALTASAGGPGTVRSGVTTVGNTPVVLDAASRELIFPDHRVALPGQGSAILQRPGPVADAVLVATESGLLRVPVAGGEPESLVDGLAGTPTDPVALDGCAHGAWSSDHPTYVVACGAEPAQVIDIPAATAASKLVFRVNGHVIVLNDQRSGAVWLVDAEMRLVDNWDDLRPQEEPSNASDSGDTGDSEQLTSTQTNCVASPQEPAPPQPQADSFGVRPGRDTVLRVLDNDVMADCSMVTIADVTALPAELGTVRVVDQGQALQVSVNATATGAVPPITYTVDDGLGHSAPSTVALTIAGSEVSKPPIRVRDSVAVVEPGGSAQYNVLQDYLSPVGDDLSLVSATVATDDTVTFQPDGLITFRDSGTAVGKRVVDITVSDGSSQVAGRLTVDVRAEGSTAPVALPILATARIGEPVTINPLRWAQSGSRRPLRLDGVTPRDGIQQAGPATARQASDGSVVLQADAPGSYYFTYQVSAGDGVGSSVLRLVVTDAPAAPAPPVPMLDVVYLPAGETITIDPMANDADPNGRGLALARIVRGGAGGLSLTERDMRTIEIAARGSLRVPEVFQYTVSNGVGSADGQVRVVPVPVLDTPPTPTSSPVAVTVRAGDAVTIPISRYASDPSGGALAVVLDEREVAAIPGALFVSGSNIRYLAPSTPPTSTITFTYTVVSTAGRSSPASTVVVTVRPADADNVAPTAPELVTARVFAGGHVDIALPLDGIDPDGDWVTLDAISGPPSLGTARPAGIATIGYDALDAPGADRLGYTVTDPGGMTTSGTVTVIVVESPNTIEPPTAPDLLATVRPGKAIAVAALSSVQGRGVTYDTTAYTSPADWTVTVDGPDLIIYAPSDPTTGVVTYHVVDERGLTASGVITVLVTDAAPVKPPTAQDVFVSPTMLSTDGTTATVDVSSRVHNASGPDAELVIGVPASSPATVTGDRTLSVPVLPVRQVLSYWVRDADGLTGQAFIVVPPADTIVRAELQVKGTVTPLRVTAGQSVDGRIADYVTSAPGRFVIIPDDARLTATQGVGTRVDPDTLRYTANVGSGGRDVLSVTATDGANDPIEIGIPVVITPVVQMPTLASGTMDIEAGSTRSVSLVPYLNPPGFPDVASLTFGATTTAPGLTASIDGSTLTVSAGVSAPKGSAGTVELQVHNNAGESAAATMTVTVTGSTKPLPVVGSFTVDGQAGVTTTVDVLAGSVDPVGGGLTVLPDLVVERGAAAVQVSGSNVSVTPAAGQVGQTVVLFTVADSTGEAERQASGRIVVTVKDRPSQPGTPVEVAGTLSNSSVSLEWAASDPRGAQQVTYRVRADGIDQECASTTCRIDGLVTGRTYRFTVVAVSEVGTSDPSNPSTGITADAVPTDPGAPTVSYVGPGQLRVSWSIPTGAFSSVDEVELQRFENGVEAGTETVGLASTKDLTGLQVATTYAFAVRVHNRQGPSNWSARSAAEKPSDVPGAPTGVQAVFQYPDPSTRSILVSWQAADGRGEDDVTYTVTTDGSSVPDVRGTSYTIPNPSDGPHSISVTASNPKGIGGASPPVSVTAFTRPDGVGTVVAKASQPLANMDVAFSGALSQNGLSALYEYSLDNGASWSAPTSGQSFTLDNLQTREYTVVGRQCYPRTAGYDESVLCGPTSTSNPATPYLPLDNIEINVEDRNGCGYITWDLSTITHGTQIVDVKFYLDDFVPTAASTTYGGVTAPCGYYVQHGFAIEVRDSAGQRATGARGFSLEPDPNRSLTVGVGGQQATSACSAPECRQIVVDGTGWAPGVSFTLWYSTDCAAPGGGTNPTCAAGGANPGTTHYASTTVVADGSGAIHDTARSFGYPGAAVWVDIEGRESNRVRF